MTPTTVFIDADGASEPYLLLLVLSPTNVVYAHQCGGYSCMQNSAEGFLVQIGDPGTREELYSWFQSEFDGSCMNSSVWDKSRIDALAEIVSRVSCWHTDSQGNDTRNFLVLDRGRMHQCVEAWIPVVSTYGQGIMVLKNSD
jgi:Family of unknown function (DUF6210)